MLIGVVVGRQLTTASQIQRRRLHWLRLIVLRSRGSMSCVSALDVPTVPRALCALAVAHLRRELGVGIVM